MQLLLTGAPKAVFELESTSEADQYGWIRVRHAHTGLIPGKYVIEIRDAAGDEVTQEIRVVSSDILPSRPPELQGDQLPVAVRETLYAIWLAAQNDGLWAFEAYQHVAGLAENYQPARILRNALEQGERPDKNSP